MKKIVVLISGQGRNLQALMDACAAGKIPAQIVKVISSKPDAGGLERARRAGLATEIVAHKNFDSRASFDAALAAAMAEPDFVLLAGFMRVLTADFVQAYRGRLVNIHPSLLPRHPGLKTHEAVLAMGDARHGASVHYVTEHLDGGPCIIQGEFMVQAQDTRDSLAERVMREVEVKIYPQALAWMARDLLRLDGTRVQFRGKALEHPLGLTDLEPEFL